MPTPNYTILVVEDDEVDRINIVRAFAKANMSNRLIFAVDGVDAISKLDANTVEKPAIILLDINMPRMNGIEFLQKLRERTDGWQNAPVVMLTTSNMDKDKIAAYNFKVAGYVVKPVIYEDFVKALGTINNYWSLNELPPTENRSLNGKN